MKKKKQESPINQPYKSTKFEPTTRSNDVRQRQKKCEKYFNYGAACKIFLLLNIKTLKLKNIY